MAILSPTLKQRFFTAAGAPLVGGKLYTYAAGTTTPLASYTDATENTANANPVILDANGECDLWLGGNAYKIVLKDSSDATQWTVDNVNQASENTSSSTDLLENLGITCSTNSNILTINLTNAAGSTPSAFSPVAIGFRSATLSSGLPSVLSVNSALGMTVSSGSTLGHTSSVSDYIYVYALNYNGAAELAVSSTLYPETALYSTTAEGGAGAADSRSVIYSIAARVNVPMRIIGRLTVLQTTAGAWALAPTQIQAGAIDQIYAKDYAETYAAAISYPTVSRYTSGSGTHSTASGCKYMIVKLVGGGSGGGGSGTGGSGGVGAAGNSTTFGTSLLTATGGGVTTNSGGTYSGGAGGTITINGPAIAITGNIGGAGGSGVYNNGTGTVSSSGGMGAASPFGGAGGTVNTGAGLGAQANSGSGGGGASSSTTNGSGTGGGGGAGGYIEALIPSPSASYAYSVGTGGAGGSAGTSGYAGGGGGSGQIIVYEYFI